jgi:hypothetical protein
MSTETLAPGWRAIPLGPWERYRRDLDGGRRVIVARSTYGGWVWDLWGTLEAPACLDLGDAATAREAMDHADRAVVTLKIVTIGQGNRCVMCRNEIDPGPAAEETSEDRWLWCGSCACRNPGSLMADGMAATA